MYTPIIAGTRSIICNVGNVLIAGVLNRASQVPRLLFVERYNYWHLTGGADKMTGRCCKILKSRALLFVPDCSVCFIVACKSCAYVPSDVGSLPCEFKAFVHGATFDYKLYIL